ncbi:shTK domain protein [Ostertagia ostertagi]
MFLYLFCALLLLSAFTAEAKLCEDASGEGHCLELFKDKKLCKDKQYKPLAKEFCQKTCGICH